MKQIVYVYVILAAFAANLADSAPVDDAQEPSAPPSDDAQESSAPPSKNRIILKPSNEDDISEIKNSSIPWVKPEFVPQIEEYKKNVFEDLKSSPQVQNIYKMQFDSKTIRDIFFKLDNKFLSEIGHPVPAALANIVSQSTSLFDPFTMPIFFEAIAVSEVSFLLTHNIDIDRSTSQNYVNLLSNALDNANLNNVDSIWRATLDAYSGFFKSYKFKILDIVDEVFELFASELIALHDSGKNSS